MKFKITHKFFKSKPPEIFTEETAPDWLTSIRSFPGSTMDNRWFWKDHVLTLPIGGTVATDFTAIERIE